MSESVETIPFVPARDFVARREGAAPSVREWIKHSIFFLLTFITTTFAGIVIAAEVEVPEPSVSGVLGYVWYIPEFYSRVVAEYISQAMAHPELLKSGLTFAAALLTILTAHEMGHYIACRFYGVRATLPFFIPAPPLFLAGTFGAFIKMKSPIPSRRALFDIGLAGPLAGFLALLPIAIGGLLVMQPAPQHNVAGAIVFNDPLLLQIIAKLIGTNLTISALNPFYMAAWIGLLVSRP